MKTKYVYVAGVSLCILFVTSCNPIADKQTTCPTNAVTTTGDRIMKSEKEWKSELTPEQYRVTRQCGTERPRSGALLHNKAKGTYTCVACGYELFSSAAKYDSGSGWPSFWKPLAADAVQEKLDKSFGNVRTEVVCPRCDAHLGHVFEDGPQPTGQRYCINSVSLDFVAAPETTASENGK